MMSFSQRFLGLPFLFCPLTVSSMIRLGSLLLSINVAKPGELCIFYARDDVSSWTGDSRYSGLETLDIIANLVLP